MREATSDCPFEGCLARAFTPLGDGVWLVGPIDRRFWVMRPEGAGWRNVAIYDAPYGCRDWERIGLLAGKVQAEPPPFPDLHLAGVLFRPVILLQECR